MLEPIAQARFVVCPAMLKGDMDGNSNVSGIFMLRLDNVTILTIDFLDLVGIRS